MNQPFNARLDFHERTEIHEASNRAPYPFAGLVFSGDCVPWMRLELLHADRDPFLLRIDLDNFRFDLLPRRKHVRRLVHALPRNFTHVQQRVSATDIDERAVIG